MREFDSLGDLGARAAQAWAKPVQALIGWAVDLGIDTVVNALWAFVWPTTLWASLPAPDRLLSSGIIVFGGLVFCWLLQVPQGPREVDTSVETHDADVERCGLEPWAETPATPAHRSTGTSSGRTEQASA